MTAPAGWDRQGKDWPHKEASRFPKVGGRRWHVQIMGSGPDLLLVHGTGAANHSWRGLAPLLAERFRVIAPDLPGHGFTTAPSHRELSLPGMAAALAVLLRALGARPALAVGHSAGAAILARMCLDGRIDPRGLLSLNGALLPLHGLAGHFWSPAAKVLAAMPMLPQLFAWQAGAPEAVERLVRGTGSSLDPEGVELYRRLITDPDHVSATLAMMANWDLDPLERDLPRLRPVTWLVAGDNDRTLSPSVAERVRLRLSGARVVRLPRLGHLAHEEAPGRVAELVLELSGAIGLAPAPSCPPGAPDFQGSSE
jgi:magnesium chelatase accessory protein